MNKFTSIKSVLYHLSLNIDKDVWNEKTMTEWLLAGLRKVPSDTILKNTIYYAVVDNHKVKLPKDLKYINQVIYKTDSLKPKEDLLKQLKEIIKKEEIPSNTVLTDFSSLSWKPLKLNESPFSKMLLCDDTYFCNQCDHEYIIDEEMILTTDIKKGIIAISYKAYPTDSNENYLMPDDEDLKESLMHYCMYRYYLSMLSNSSIDKSLLNFYVQERQFNLKQFELLKTKYVAKANTPTVDQMENIKNQNSRLFTNSNAYDKLFTNLNKREKLKYV